MVNNVNRIVIVRLKKNTYVKLYRLIGINEHTITVSKRGETKTIPFEKFETAKFSLDTYPYEIYYADWEITYFAQNRWAKGTMNDLIAFCTKE